MRRKPVFILILLMFLACSQCPRFQQNWVRASDEYPVHNLNTGLNYTTIQEAINANETLDGHTIHVDAGTYDTIYTEVNKSVSLIGGGRESTTILGIIDVRYLPIIWVASNNVTISGFTLRGGLYGIYTTANYTHVTNCTISDNGYGIQSFTYFRDIYRSEDLSGSIIHGNILTNNSEYGMILVAKDDIIFDNVIIGNNMSTGIYLEGPGGSIIYGNTVRNNQLGCWIFSHNNTIFHNNFLHNRIQASSPIDVNNWNTSIEGNYWSDYNGTDENHDGIGDTSYLLGGDRFYPIPFENNTDHYPLMGSFSSYNATSEDTLQTISNSTISNFSFDNTTVRFCVSGKDNTTGFCRMCIPFTLMNSPFRVFINGTETGFTTLYDSNSTHSYLYFNYTHSTKEVTIVPEFPSFLILPLFMIATLLAFIVFRRKHQT